MKIYRLIGVLIALLIPIAPLPALMTEDWGNEPRLERDYVQWDGIMPIVNHEDRVYAAWVNGYEDLHFLSNSESLNQILEQLRPVKTRELRVELLNREPKEVPMGLTRTSKEFDWVLRLSDVGRVIHFDEGKPKPAGPPITIQIYLGSAHLSGAELKIPDGFSVTVKNATPVESKEAASVDPAPQSSKIEGDSDKVVPTQLNVAKDELTKAISDILMELHALKVGMTRGDALNLFEEEGGLSNRSQITYVSKHCPYIKVSFGFEPAGEIGDGFGYPYPESDIIKQMSRPYLQWSIGD